MTAAGMVVASCPVITFLLATPAKCTSAVVLASACSARATVQARVSVAASRTVATGTSPALVALTQLIRVDEAAVGVPMAVAV